MSDAKLPLEVVDYYRPRWPQQPLADDTVYLAAPAGDGSAMRYDVIAIPREKFDPWAILELFMKHHGKTH